MLILAPLSPRGEVVKTAEASRSMDVTCKVYAWESGGSKSSSAFLSWCVLMGWLGWLFLFAAWTPSALIIPVPGCKSVNSAMVIWC